MFDGTSKKELKEERSDYYYFGQYKAPLLYYSLLQNWADPQESTSSIPLVNGQIVVLDGHQFIMNDDWKGIYDAATHALDTKDTQFFEDFFTLSKNTTEALTKELQTLLSVSTIETFFISVHVLQYPWYLVLPMAQAMEDWLKPHVSSDELMRFFEPDQATLQTRYEQACRHVCQLISEFHLSEFLGSLPAMEFIEKVKSDSPRIWKEIETIEKNFAWVGYMHFWGEGNSAEKIVENIKRTTGEKESSENILSESDFAWVLKYSRKVTYYRQHFAELCALATRHLYIFLQEKNISPDDVLSLTPDEFLHFLETGISVSRDVLEERKKGYGLFNTVVTGEELKRLMNVLVDVVDVNQIIKGTVASKGRARGRVKIIMSPGDMIKMEEGDVLVAHETTPDLVPAMNKAVAIVTDVGGLTSHAAIVSREMKKPCIIGTKVGTTILKDGDFVEVDACPSSGVAERGVVTLIN